MSLSNAGLNLLSHSPLTLWIGLSQSERSVPMGGGIVCGSRFSIFSFFYCQIIFCEIESSGRYTKDGLVVDLSWLIGAVREDEGTPHQHNRGMKVPTRR